MGIFPLFPIIVRYICFITTADINYVASLLSTVLLGLAELVGYKYIIMTRNNISQGIGYIFFMSFGAYSFYFSLFYTESLYLFLLTCAFYFMKKEEYIKMGIVGALLSMTRNTGVFLCIVVLVHQIKRYRANLNGSFAGFVKEIACNYKLIVGTMLIPLGFFSYMLYLKYRVGDAFAFMHVQKAWGKKFLGVWTVLGDGLFDLFPPSYLGVCALLSIYLIIVLICKHRHVEEAIIPIITLVIAATSTLYSVPRYMAGSFAVILAFTDEWKGCTKLNQFLICVGMFLLEIACIKAWLNGSSLLI